jgi:hypothetical protein
VRAPVKIGLVAAGYVGAFLVASAVVAVYVAATSGPDRQTYGVMYDFGDSLLFLGVFAAVGVLPTGAALFFLRPNRMFWAALSAAALAIAATALAAFIAHVMARAAGTSSMLYAWSSLAGLRILVAPLFALAFFLSGLLAPNRASRITLFGVTVIEAGVFAYAALVWFHPGR